MLSFDSFIDSLTDKHTHKLSPRATARVPTPLHTTPALTMIRHHVIPLVVIVRAGVVWSGVGTLAVALVVGLLLHHQ